MKTIEHFVEANHLVETQKEQVKFLIQLQVNKVRSKTCFYKRCESSSENAKKAFELGQINLLFKEQE